MKEPGPSSRGPETCSFASCGAEGRGTGWGLQVARPARSRGTQTQRQSLISKDIALLPWSARGGSRGRARGPGSVRWLQQGTSRQQLLTLGCPSRRTLWRTWQNFQLRMELLGRGRPMA